MATWLHWSQKPGYLNVLPLVCRHPSNKQKLLIYKVGVCPRLAWLLIIEEFPISWVEKHLDSLASKFLKKLVRLSTLCHYCFPPHFKERWWTQSACNILLPQATSSISPEPTDNIKRHLCSTHGRQRPAEGPHPYLV